MKRPPTPPCSLPAEGVVSNFGWSKGCEPYPSPLDPAPQRNEPAAAMTTDLLNYYEAIEQASKDMLEAARRGDWDQVVKLEGACAVLIGKLKLAAAQPLASEQAQLKSRIMQRILVNDAEIRNLAEPWLDELDHLLAGRAKTLH